MKPEVREAFAECVEVELPRARRAAFLMCGDWAEADDLAQQAMVRMYGAWGRLERNGSMRAWVATTVARLWLDEQRRRRRRPVHLVADVPEAPGESASMVESDVTDRDRLMLALMRLPERQRACLVLRYWEDQSVQETARTMRCSEGNVKSLSHHGLRTLREHLGPMNLDEDLR